MNMPGFTAQVSLSKTSQPYRAIAPNMFSTGDIELMFHKTFVTELLDIPLYVYTINSPRLCEIRYEKCMEKCSSYKSPIVHGGGQWGEGIYDENLGVVGGRYQGYCRLQCEHRYNCGTDRVCLWGECCPKEKVCGDVCCGQEEDCLKPGKCCPKSWLCGDICCEYPSRCTIDGCCPPDRAACHNRCCGPGEKCTIEGCCPVGRAVCNNHCCNPGEDCINNACLPCGSSEGQAPCADGTCHGGLHLNIDMLSNRLLCTASCGNSHQHACRTTYRVPGGVRSRYRCFNHSRLFATGPANPSNCVCVPNTINDRENDVSDDSGFCISTFPAPGDIADPPDCDGPDCTSKHEE